MKLIAIIGGIVIAVLIAAVVAILIFVDTNQPFLQKTANLSVTLIAVLACGLLIAVTALVALLAALVGILNNLTKTKVGPLIDKISEATDTARGTVAYVGEGVVSPMVRLASILAGLRGAIGVLFRRKN